MHIKRGWTSSNISHFGLDCNIMLLSLPESLNANKIEEKHDPAPKSSLVSFWVTPTPQEATPDWDKCPNAKAITKNNHHL